MLRSHAQFVSTARNTGAQHPQPLQPVAGAQGLHEVSKEYPEFRLIPGCEASAEIQFLEVRETSEAQPGAAGLAASQR